MRSIALVLLVALVPSLKGVADVRETPKQDRLITSRSVGPVRLGMSVAAAKRALKGFTLERTRDGEVAALIAVERGKNTVMIMFAGEHDDGAALNRKALIEDIQVLDSSYATKAGVHPGMLLSEVEKHYGKVKEVELSQ